MADRGINKTRNFRHFSYKCKQCLQLVTNVNNAYKMNVEISVTDYVEEKNDVEMNLQSKLVLENGQVRLPDPSKLIDECFAAPFYLPNIIYEQINAYLKDTDAGKAFKGEKSLLLSGQRM